ncbi:SAM-dependent methyltransferase [Nocardia blacklockiae]|uniref:SAM-dependent methyltransferase n=1 Tax=Nocardia blacklockiae TaxID=480036 RepID=UPI00189306BA|nr:SAM-dependent methyltransferase [Nocardia blacklockiae]MBF6176015.1 SAM-dependent methyltransferase [Nocardia blacklockiae]
MGRPSLCRMYNHWLRGKDHYPVDRDACHYVTGYATGWELAVRASREWLRHRVCDLAAAGVDQFLVLGAGLPVASEPAVHELASRALGGRPARVVYVEADPLAALYNHAELADHVVVHAVRADLTDPADVRHRVRAAGSVVDWSRPVAVLLPDSLPHVPDDPGHATVVRRWRAMLAPGSWIVASHYTDPGLRSAAHLYAAVLQQQFTAFVGSGWFRSRAEIEACFDGLELLPPGISDLTAWPTAVASATPLPMEARLILCGLGRIPDPDQQPGDMLMSIDTPRGRGVAVAESALAVSLVAVRCGSNQALVTARCAGYDGLAAQVESGHRLLPGR